MQFFLGLSWNKLRVTSYNMKQTLTIIIILATNFTFGQFSEQKIITDSSEIEIIRNSVYKIYEETFKFKDSVFYSVSYIKDTSIIENEGWSRKNKIRIGKWKKYNPDGIWINTIDYDKDSWEYNKEKFPYFCLLDSMKLLGDRLIIDKYGKPFFEKNVRYQFWGSVSQEFIVFNDTGIIKQIRFIGDWNEPHIEKPNIFQLQYSIQLDKDHIYDNGGSIIEINLDSLGNLIKEDNKYNLSFDGWKKGESETFSLTYNKAIEICQQNGMIKSDTMKYITELQINSNKSSLYSGRFIFEIVQNLSYKVIDGTCPEKCNFEITYRKWLIDPWTSELLENRKYRSFGHWSHGNGGGGENIEIIE